MVSVLKLRVSFIYIYIYTRKPLRTHVLLYWCACERTEVSRSTLPWQKFCIRILAMLIRLLVLLFQPLLDFWPGEVLEQECSSLGRFANSLFWFDKIILQIFPS